MPRAAGDSPTYSYTLRRKGDGEPWWDTREEIHLPSVTTIIHRNLASPALVPWAYRQTIESVEILLEHAHTLLDVTADDLDGLLTENRLRPVDIRDEAATRGTAAHAWLEELATAPAAAYSLNRGGYLDAVSSWWKDRTPVVMASECLLVSLRHGYAGTADLVWVDKRGKVVLTDLKTRDNTWTQAYESDLIQLAAYKEAWEEGHPGKKIDRTSVLIAKPNGSWIEDSRALPFETFGALLELDRLLAGVRK